MPAAGDSAVVQTWYRLGVINRVECAVLFDSGDGSFTATPLTRGINGRLLRLVTDPGAVAPTTLYDITLVDPQAIDALHGVGADRHTSNIEDALIVWSGTAVHPIVMADETLTLTIANQSVNSATTLIIIYFEDLS